MRDALFIALHLAAALLHVTSAVLLLLVRRESSTSNPGRLVLRVLPGGLSTQQEVSRG